MKNKLNLKAISFLIGAIFISSFTSAQEEGTKPNAPSPNAPSPIPVEVFFGNNRLVTQFSFNKKVTENSKFGFMVTSFTASDYGNNKSENESMNAAYINYEILKGFSVVGGAALNSQWGFRPYSGLQYFYADKNFMAMVMPGFYLTESHNFETVGFVEYRPHLKNDWSLYTRLEGLYNVDMNTKKHDRSFINARLGLSYKTFGFGLAMNNDWYGPFKVEKNNTGIFIRKVF